MRGKTIDPANIGEILIRAVNWLGDAVMTTPAIGTVREFFPTARITLLATPLVAELFTPHPWVDELLVYDRNGRHRGIGGRLRLAAELNARAFDLAIILPNSFDSALVPWLAGIPRRLGLRSDGRGMLLNYGMPKSLQSTTGHQSEAYRAILAHFGITASAKPQLLATTSAEDGAIAELLRSGNINPDDVVVGINPGATYGSAKRWYPERFAAVADDLAGRWGAKIVITGGPDETGIAADIAATMTSPCLNLAGRTKVRELMAVIKRCTFFVTNDSGPMHIAAAFGVPLVAIFGSTDHTTTYPLAEHALVVCQQVDCAPCMKRECPTDHRCMTAVTPAMVVEAAEKLKTSSTF
ncbi:lipopolysaccharide heptosyltransferase II [Geobacter argillaceus]|uniref:lipopolysaccharide heptosyltransferase II n=1 Tax=Geobacter argillaceus TaxID=345631 RepID=A0A562VNG0_9BACT|nr:lipopolysaccharide heptosyltransferase II [Geobacter argillaceus]TWJ19284.1 heptosyltransferase-2 [Geobacter argillaceus]